MLAKVSLIDGYCKMKEFDSSVKKILSSKFYPNFSCAVVRASKINKQYVSLLDH